jgi:signal transduction histidine kinase
MTLQNVDRAWSGPQALAAGLDQLYEHEETRRLVALVKEAAELIHAQGEKAFGEFRVAGSRWRQGDTYVFVLDREGNMLVHPDPALEGRNTLDLKDIIGKPIIRGLIDAATRTGKPEGWYHYQWPVPGGLLPRWKSAYVQLVVTPSGTSYVVGSGLYNDRMERAFVQDAVAAAVTEIEQHGEEAFPLFRDPKGPFIVKDAYIFVMDSNGVELFNPAFPNLVGRSLLDFQDTESKLLIREMLAVVRTRGSGWVDYMWPKPGESVSTRKSAFVSKATVGNTWLVVGCGVYLADAPKAARAAATMTAPELMRLVRDAAAVFEQRGEQAFPEFRQKGSRWFRNDTYFFVQTLEGRSVLHAADPEGLEGSDVSGLTDILGRPFGRMIPEAGSSPSGEGWVHYMYPKPEEIFPSWKSMFVKRVAFPSGRQYLVGSGIYNMQMDRVFVEDLVDRAAALVARLGADAFPLLRDKTGPFVFMDTYVFVHTMDGTELVNPAHPTLEGRNLTDLSDVEGKPVVEDQIAATLKADRAWLDCYWYKPGDNRPARKRTYVRKVHSGTDVYIVGSCVYLEEEPTD